LLHLVGLSVLLYLIDDARSNKNQVVIGVNITFHHVKHDMEHHTKM